MSKRTEKQTGASGVEGRVGHTPGHSTSSEPENPGLGCTALRRWVLEAHHPDEPLPEEMQRHLDRCPRCQVFRSQVLLLDEVARAQAPEIPDGFELSLRRRLQQPRQGEGRAARTDAEGTAKPTQRRGRVRVALAAAAVVLLSVGGLWVATRWRGGHEERFTYHQLRLVIRSAEEHQEVLFDVDLPEGVRLLPAAGDLMGRGRTLQWRSAIRQGVSEVDLPLVAQQAKGQLHVRLRSGGRVWTGDVAFGGTPGHAAGRTLASEKLQLAWVLGPRSTMVERGDL